MAKDIKKQIEKMRKQPGKMKDNGAFGFTGGDPFERAKKRKEGE